MKRIIKAASADKRYTNARYAINYKKALVSAGVSESDIVEYFYDYLPLETYVKVLEKIAKVCDCEEEVAELVADYMTAR